MTLRQLLATAGRLSDSEKQQARILRTNEQGKTEICKTVDISALFQETAPDMNLESGDVIDVLSESAAQAKSMPTDRSSDSKSNIVSIMGQINRPGAYNISKEHGLTLLQLLASVGLQDKAKSQVSIFRDTEMGQREIFQNIDIVSLFNGTISDVELQPGDVVNVNSTQRVQAPAGNWQSVDSFSPDQQGTEVVLAENFRVDNDMGRKGRCVINMGICAKVAQGKADELRRIAESRKTEIRDAIRTVVASAQFEQIKDPKLQVIKREIKARVETIVGKGLIQDILVTNWQSYAADPN